MIQQYFSELINMTCISYWVIQITLDLWHTGYKKPYAWHKFGLTVLLLIPLGLRIYYYLGVIWGDFSRVVEGSYFVAWPSPAVWILAALLTRYNRLESERYNRLKQVWDDYTSR